MKDEEYESLDHEDPRYWEERFRRVTSMGPVYKSVEDLRDAVDPGWRERERFKLLSDEGLPSRQLPDSLGKVGGREYRQINVKLGAPDFEVLKTISRRRDIAPSTLARVLLRNAIRDVAEGKRSV